MLLVSIVINAVTSYFIQWGAQNKRRLIAAAGVIANLGILAFFKYSPLFASTVFSGSNDNLSNFLLTIPLPVGISFYTFQGISLVLDTYKEDKRESIVPKGFMEHFRNTIFFISFFPQLVAGPIVKAYDFIPQIAVKTLKDINWEYCFRCLVVGYFLKMVVADNLKDQTFWIAYPYFERYASITLIVMLLGYSMQIFADFAGYSLIALGVAGLFGYRLMDNFNFPYISRSFSEFWRRWHISLSSFLKEYLYVPLGGNRKGAFRTYLNLMIVMFLGGLWHGAAWSYAVWGTFHGVALALERFLGSKIKLPDTGLIRFVQMVLVFSFVTLAWLLFKLPDFSYAVLYFKALFTNWHIAPGSLGYAIMGYTILYSLPVVLYHLHYLYAQKLTVAFVIRKTEVALYAVMLFMLAVNSGTANEFIYFQF
nr:MBOAT family O-acyltransferase [Pontibacter vulgaris]